MARQVKWARDLHSLRERVVRAKTEIWSRQEIEALFGISRVSAQNLMKAIGAVQTVAGAHFVERPSLLAFLDAMLEAPSVETALRERMAEAEPAPRPQPLRTSLPADLRHAMLPDLPGNITLSPGRIEIRADDAVGMLESLLTLAMVMQNDLDRFRASIEAPAGSSATDQGLRDMLQRLRQSRDGC